MPHHTASQTDLDEHSIVCAAYTVLRNTIPERNARVADGWTVAKIRRQPDF